MRKLLVPLLRGSKVLFVLIGLSSSGPSTRVVAQTSCPDPAHERACPSQTGAGGGAEAIPAFVGTGSDGFSPNQSLCLPQLAPVPSGSSPEAFIVSGSEPGDRVDSQGTIYVGSIRGVSGGVDLWRWSQSIEGAANANGTLPFKYEGQPDNCGIFGLNGGGCANNVGSPTNLGVAPGGGDADIAVNAPDPNNAATPNLPFTSLTLAPGVTATNSRNRGDTFFTPPNAPATAVRLRISSRVALDPEHRANLALLDDHLASPLCSQQSPGHCANNDPASFRVAVPYFTYQMRPNKKIVTTGLCAK